MSKMPFFSEDMRPFRIFSTAAKPRNWLADCAQADGAEAEAAGEEDRGADEGAGDAEVTADEGDV